MISKAFIPYRGYYSTPFCRWQGSMANDNAVVLAGNTSKRWLLEKDWEPTMFDYVFFGITIGQPQWFYGNTWAAALMGAERTPGMNICQACSTSTTCIFQAAVGIETGLYQNCYALMADRCSNGPHCVWANPIGPGGTPHAENWMLDNFKDPWAMNAMIETAENVAREAGITREQCDEVALRRYEQYQMALDNDRAFQKRYMFPAEVSISKGKTALVQEDEGVMTTTKEGLLRLKSVLPGGVHSFGSQTHPADGNCAVVVTTEERSKELSADPSVRIQVISYGYARAKKGFMAAAPVPAMKMALSKAEIAIQDVKTIKTHNPFAVNDLYLSQQMDIDVMDFNNYGSSLIFGHPQGPTIGRLVMEGIEEVVIRGGGYLLCGGCAGGDSGAALVLKIG